MCPPSSCGLLRYVDRAEQVMCRSDASLGAKPGPSRPWAGLAASNPTRGILRRIAENLEHRGFVLACRAALIARVSLGRGSACRRRGDCRRSAFNAPARIVLEAWTRPELLKRWWAPTCFFMPGRVRSNFPRPRHLVDQSRMKSGTRPPLPMVRWCGHSLGVQTHC